MDQLISNTIAYLRQEGHLTKSRPIIKASPLPEQKKVEKKKEPEVVVQPPKPVEKEAPAPLAFQKIRKHLPGIQLVEQIPAPEQVAILVTSQEDLARAIQDKFCPVKLLAKPVQLDAFTFVLASVKPEGMEEGRHIRLQAAEVYEQDPTQKKVLWNSLCQLLKSS
jgi:hypothetical protein